MPLAHAIVTAPAATPSRYMLFLHGILGSGANWRTFAKQLVAARPDWGAVLVDLRLHGDSQKDFAPPHTIAAAAEDVEELIAALEGSSSISPGRVRGVLAHSFGGKVALALARQRRGDLDRVYVVDSTPSARPDARGSESTRHIVELLTQLPDEFSDRQSFTTWMEGRGVSRPVAMWLAMNVRPLPGGAQRPPPSEATGLTEPQARTNPGTTRFVFRVDVAGIRQLLDDYFCTDLWDVLEHPEGAMQAHLIVGGRSNVVDEADRERAKHCPRTTLDVIADADHWVHVDAPDALRAIVLGYLS